MGEGIPKPTAARFAIAENLKRLMANYRDPETGVKGLSSRELAAKAPGVSYKTVDRMLNPYHATAPNLDSLDVVAHFFGLETDLLMRRTSLLSGSEGAGRKPETQPIAQAIPARKKRPAG